LLVIVLLLLNKQYCCAQLSGALLSRAQLSIRTIVGEPLSRTLKTGHPDCILKPKSQMYCIRIHVIRMCNTSFGIAIIARYTRDTLVQGFF